MIADRIADRIAEKLPPEDLSKVITSFDEAYAVQETVSSFLSKKLGGIAGYKIAWNNAAQMAEMAPNAPGVASVLGDHVQNTGVKLSTEDIIQLVVEPEIIAVIGNDFEGSDHTPNSAKSKIERFHAGFEIMDRRNAPEAVLNYPPVIVANNIFNNGLVIGGGCEANAVDYTKIETILTHDGEELLRKTNAAPQNPAQAVATVANFLATKGKSLKSGDLVLCGTHLAPFEVKSGHLSVSMGILGSAEFTYG